MADSNDQIKNSSDDCKEEEIIRENPATTCTSATKPRHDWYQTGSDVYINIMIKKLAKEDVRVQFEPSLVSAAIELADGVKHCMEWNLAHTIVPSKSSYKVLSTKVEMKMRKDAGIQWSSLETSTTSPQPAPASNTVSSDDPVHKYPSSSHYTRNWDSLVTEIKKEEEEEKPEGDAAVNKLFQQIYSGGSDEVRRAMNKSFVESKGTVLSTNWSEVGNKDVEMKPPDGMEWKKYDN